MKPCDVIIYVYDDAAPPPRAERLLACAAHYAAKRGLPPGDFTLDKGFGGKPFFSACPQIHFSLSHSGSYWLAAFHGAPVGLDIQAHTERDYLRIAKRWFHPQEYAAVSKNGPQSFFDIWSAKESLCKQSGAGINAAFPRFCATENGGMAARCNGLQLRRVELFSAYSVYVCAEQIDQIEIKHEQMNIFANE